MNSQIKSKTQENMDLLLGLIKATPGIHANDLRKQYSKVFKGMANCGILLIQLHQNKMVKRFAVQLGNPSAGHLYWPLDASPVTLNRTQLNSVKVPGQNKGKGPVAHFSKYDQPEMSL